MAFLAVLLIGVVAVSQLQIDLFPEIETPAISIAGLTTAPPPALVRVRAVFEDRRLTTA